MFYESEILYILQILWLIIQKINCYKWSPTDLYSNKKCQDYVNIKWEYWSIM